MKFNEPSADECSIGAAVTADDGTTGVAMWYPQMGGYSGKCIVVRSGDCFDAFVWHSGEFPFEEQSPVQLHHCDPEQFICFGERVREKLFGGVGDVVSKDEV